ncbi:MAG: hypothetical protein HY809_06795 [Nitrospirae bacterium]|nr:hypothetical protein [Nitrospirota bacterium]
MGLLKWLFQSGTPAPKLQVHPDDEDLITEDDIQWWESLTLSDCKVMEEQDHVAQYALFMKLTNEDGLSEEEAIRRVRKTHLYYYGTLKQRENELLGFKGDDAKLPYIVKDKANKAVMKFVRKMDKGKRESASSMNAIVRNLIRAKKV